MNFNRYKTIPFRIPVVCALLLAAGLFTGCESSDNNDDGNSEADNNQPRLGAFNAVSDMGSITIVTSDNDEEQVWSHLGFAQSVSAVVNDGEIGYRFETALPSDDINVCTGDEDADGVKDDDECTRLAEGAIDIATGNEYILMLYGKYNDMEVLQYDKPRHQFDTEIESEDGDPEDENMEIWFFHLAEALGEVDIYLEAPGTNLSPVQALNTLSLKGSFHTLLDADGDGDEYVLTVTEKADPTAVLFTSETFELYEQTRVGFVLRDGAGDGTSPVKVTLFQDKNKTLVGRNTTTKLRIAHAVPDGGNIDVYTGMDTTTTPFVANLAVGQTSDYGDVLPGELIDLSLNATLTGDPNFIAMEDLDLTRGQKATYYFVGEPSDWDGVKVTDDTRRIATHAQLRLVNGADSTLDYYIVERNDNISTLDPAGSLAFRHTSGWLGFAPGTYDIVITNTGTDTIVYDGTVELAAGGLYTAVSTNNSADPTTADMVYLDDFVETSE